MRGVHIVITIWFTAMAGIQLSVARPQNLTTALTNNNQECGPEVQVGDQTFRGVCFPSEGAVCSCFVEQRCPTASAECNKEDFAYCCCYVLVNPPDQCYDDDRVIVTETHDSHHAVTTEKNNNPDGEKKREKIKRKRKSHLERTKNLRKTIFTNN